VLDQVPVLVAYVDADERYRYNNRHYETTFGLRRRNLSGRTIRSVLGDAAYEQVRPHVAAALSGRTVSFESTMDYAAAGRREVTAIYMPDIGEEGRIWGFVAVVNDVTDLKAAERRYREQMLEVAHATRLASVGELATQIAHEVNQPLTAIVTYCAAAQHQLRHEPAADARLAGLIAAIADEAQRVSDIIRRLRAFIRKGEISFVAVDVNEVVVDTVRLISADATAKKVALQEGLESGPLMVMADPVLLSQAVLNLIRNAVEAVAAGSGPERVVTVATRRKDAVVELSIQDTGPGLPPEVAAQLFESFVTTKEGGLGMGLAIARSIVEAHGGQIRHAAAPAGGTLFLIHLPGVDA
jgi:PAS domain S-box-containing protein